VIYFVISRKARSLSSVQAQRKKERFLASLGMTKGWGTFSAPCKADFFSSANVTAEQAAEKVPWFVILSEAKNPSWIKTKD
jgi:hypothetical protein